MPPPNAARLIMLTGTSAGSGKSTAMRALAARFGSLGRDVLQIDEDAVWGDRRLDTAPVDHTTALPLFYDLLHRERATGDRPGPDEVIGAFQRLVDEALHRHAVWLQDWTWSDLPRLLGWDHQLVRTTSQRLQRVGAALTPIVIYLRVDPEVALSRALAERGPVWFNRHAGTPVDAPVTAATVDRMAVRSRRSESSRLDDLTGWTTAILDAAAPPDQVVDAAWRELHNS